ncbi:MAG: hypothetical protein ACJAZM_000108 [Cyclobacteriaceae bacterium]|jgi:hypothetical protein
MLLIAILGVVQKIFSLILSGFGAIVLLDTNN